MSASISGDLVLQRTRKIARDYIDRGYRVDFDVPIDTEGGPRPVDLVAVSDQERVLIEVKHLASIPNDDHLRQLAEYAARHPGTRLELVTIGSLEEYSPAQVQEASRAILSSRLEEARELLALAHVEGALLLAWGVIEGTLRLIEDEHGVKRTSIRRSNDFASLYSLGLLSQWQFELLREGQEARNRVAHGFPSDSGSGLVEQIVNLAALLLQPDRPLVGEMVDWFVEHYEDPAQRVPHDSAEGGYQYVFGGPYVAREELTEQFPNAYETDIDEAVSILERDSLEWVKKAEY